MKKIFAGGGMDQDLEDRLVEPNDVRRLLNARIGGAEDADIGSVPKVKGNLLGGAPADPFEPGSVTVGAFNDKKNNRIIYMDWSPTSNHRIYEYDTLNDTTTLISESSVWDFDKDFLIWHMDVIDDNIWAWTDDNKEPRKINRNRALNTHLGTGTDQYPTPLNSNDLNMIKIPPLCPPDVVYGNESQFPRNMLKNKLWQFRYSYVYQDNELSTMSPISKVALPPGEEFEQDTPVVNSGINNKIDISLLTGDKEIKEIKIYAREGNLGDFFLIETLNKNNLSIANNVTHVYSFLNDQLPTPVDINYSNRNFDRVPLKAACQDLTDDNRMIYVNILTDFDNVKTDVDIEPIFRSILDISSAVITVDGDRDTGAHETDIPFANPSGSFYLALQYNFPATVSEGQFISISFITSFFPFDGFFTYNYTVQAGDTAKVVVDVFVDAINNDPNTQNRTFLGDLGVSPGGSLVAARSGIVLSLTTIVNSSTPSGAGLPKYRHPRHSLQTSVPNNRSHKRGATHPFVIIYFDYANRQGAANFAGEVSIAHVTDTVNKGVVDMKLTIHHAPPSWAVKYQIGYAGNQTMSDSIQFIAGTVGSAPNNRKTINLQPILDFKNDNTNSILSYEFVKGDRIRFLKSDVNTFYGNLIDVEVESSTNNIITFPDPGISIVAGALIEIYSPKNTLSEKFYFEIGECYDIINGAHQGNTQNQNISPSSPAIVTLINQGDVYLKNRVMNNNSFTVEDFNYSDFYDSKVINIGRAHAINPDNRQIRRETAAFISEPFLPDSSINGLNSFFGFSFPGTPSRAKEYDQKKGPVMRIYVDGKRLVMYQELRVGQVFINENILFDQSGETQVQTSNQILSDISYYSGEFGIGLYPGSFAVYGHTQYFADPKRGVVCRLSQDGITRISKYKMHNYFTDTFKGVLKGETHLMAVYDAKFKEYVLVIQKKVITEIKIDGTFRPGQGGSSFVLFPSGTDFTNLSAGSDVTISYLDIRTELQTSAVVKILLVNEESSFINIDTSELELSDSLNEGDPITVIIATKTIGFSETIAFNEEDNKWAPYYSYTPQFMVENDTDIVTFDDGMLWRHNEGPICNFYGVQYDAEITFVANESPRDNKFWLAIEEQVSDSSWEMVEATNQAGQKTSLIDADFEDIEGVFWAEILKDENTPVTDPIIEGDDMRSPELTIKLRHKGAVFSKLFSIGVRYELSERTNK